MSLGNRTTVLCAQTRFNHLEVMFRRPFIKRRVAGDRGTIQTFNLNTNLRKLSVKSCRQTTHVCPTDRKLLLRTSNLVSSQSSLYWFMKNETELSGNRAEKKSFRASIRDTCFRRELPDIIGKPDPGHLFVNCALPYKRIASNNIRLNQTI